jgi:5'-3' exonuclease
MKDKILVIDALNVFFRHWAANPSTDSNGEPIGGIVGFLKGLQLLCERYSPRDIVVIWEGGGSTKRRGLNQDYKAGRKPITLNRFYEDDIPETPESRDRQIQMLVSLLRQAGLKQIYVSGCEADDVIAYVINSNFRDQKCVIVSTDKDFYQLVDDRVVVWSPGSKKQWDVQEIITNFGIHPQNFCLARCFVGDASDDLKGAQGVGFKSLIKNISDFASEKSLTVDDVINICKAFQKTSKLKFFENIIKSEDQAKKNWELMYLGYGKLSGSQVKKINDILDLPQKRDKLSFIRTLASLRITGVDYDKLFMSLKMLN